MSEQHAHEPLSDEMARNWAYDGRVYVDFAGNQRTLRPDIEPMLEDYLVRQNERVTSTIAWWTISHPFSSPLNDHVTMNILIQDK